MVNLLGKLVALEYGGSISRRRVVRKRLLWLAPALLYAAFVCSRLSTLSANVEIRFGRNTYEVYVRFGGSIHLNAQEREDYASFRNPSLSKTKLHVETAAPPAERVEWRLPAVDRLSMGMRYWYHITDIVVPWWAGLSVASVLPLGPAAWNRVGTIVGRIHRPFWGRGTFDVDS